MVTMVGNEGNIEKLERNCFTWITKRSPHMPSIARLDDKNLSGKIARFKQDHLQHVSY